MTIPPPLDLLAPVSKELELVEETKEPGTEEAETGEAGDGEPGVKEAGEGGPAPPPLNPVSLSDTEARTSLHSLVSTHCCWGSGVVKQMR